MARNRCEIIVKIVVYYVIFSNISFPILLLLGEPYSCITISDILTCVVWIGSGVLLLIGTVQGKEMYFRVYVIVIGVCLLIVPILIGLSSRTNEIACENRNNLTIILILMYFILMWPFQYCVYLFYKQMALSGSDAEEI